MVLTVNVYPMSFYERTTTTRRIPGLLLPTRRIDPLANTVDVPPRTNVLANAAA